jgi:galactokinase
VAGRRPAAYESQVDLTAAVESNAAAGSVADRAAAAFKGRYDASPAGVWAAPARANLIGEHTDYNDGFVLPFALSRHTVVAAAPLPPARWSVWSELTGEEIHLNPDDVATPGRVTGWGAYVAGVVWALREAGFTVPGARLAIASDVPPGAGLSSSAALEAATLSALAELGALNLPTEQRPPIAQRAENEYAGIPCGIMDQVAAIRCRRGHALFLDCRSLEVDHIPFDLPAAGLAVLVIDSRAPHKHVSGEYAARRQACESAAKELGVRALRDVPLEGLDDAVRRLPDEVARRRVRHVVTENQRVCDVADLLRADDARGIGLLLTASHASMRDDFEITVPQVDTAVTAALGAGAYGARMTGGGFGGCVLALVDADATDRVAAAVVDAYAEAGYDPPETFPAVPSDGAHRVR